jgi:hypothetical protein
MPTVDLSAYYTYSLDSEIHHKPGNDLAAVPHGTHGFAGTVFLVEGLIQLSGSISVEKTGETFPDQVRGIVVGLRGKELHFLQSSSWHDAVGSVIGEYVVHYADGQSATIPIVYGHSVVDWWFMDSDPLPTDAVVAWKGDNERTEGLGHSIQLYKFTWTNPRPDVSIQTIDFVSRGQESAPFLMAISVE